MKSKKGAWTQEQVMIAIVLAITAAVFISVYFLLDFSGQSDWETCHNSIILRGAARIGTLTEIGPKAIPLSCKTEKFCVADTKESEYCQKEIPTTKDNPTKMETYDGSIREKKSRVIDFMAEQIYQCHRLVGEGKSNFLPSEFTGTNYCVLCGRIQIDPKLAAEIENNGGIKHKEIFERLAEKKAPSGKSYLEEVYRMKDPKLGEVFFDEVLKKSYQNDPNIKDFDWSTFTWDNWNVPISGQLAIITSINEGGYGWKYIAGVTTAVVVIGAVLLAVPSFGTSLVAVPSAVVAVGSASTVAGAVTAAVKATPILIEAGKTTYTLLKRGVQTGGAVYVFTSIDASFEYSPPSLQVYDVDTLKSLGCHSFETAP